ncbi:MAG: hypothetical protein J6L69_10450 [Lachnospiraceae bacterium]|nr:hypothetical protein [Lachnospiraceae bacterium]
MSKRLIVEYEGTDTLEISLIEAAIKEIHESPKGKLISIHSETEINPKQLEVIIPMHKIDEMLSHITRGI